MKIKTFTILIIIAVALSAGAYFLVKQQTGRSSEIMMGRLLFQELPADRIKTITVQGPEESVYLQELEGQWVVQSRMNYPADIAKLSDLVRKLREARIGRAFESTEGSLKRLALMDPAQKEVSSQEKGIGIIFKDEKEKEIINIILGKSRDTGDPRGTSEGHYLRLHGDSNIYLVDRDFSALEATAPHWLETELMSVPASDIKVILCQSTDKEKIQYAFERPAEGEDFEAVEFPAGKKVDKSTLNQLSRALASLQMEDVVDPAILPEASLEMSYLIEFQLFNGLIYRFRPSDTCAQGDTCYLKIEVAYQKPLALAEGKGDTPDEQEEQEEEPVEDQRDLSQEAHTLNEKFRPWVYIISGWEKDDLVTDVSKLIEEAEE